jgi:hypothetical protein
VNIESSAKCIKEILDEYKKRADFEEVPLDVEILRDIIRDRAGLKTLHWEAVGVNTENLYGYVKFYYPVPAHIRTIEEPTTAIIRIKESLNYCWKRFVLCKEMCHCLIDLSNEDRVFQEAEFMKLLEGLSSGIIIPFGNGPIATESLAEIMALELLYPLELRKSHLSMVRSSEVSPYALALRYRLPQEYAEFGMHETYLEFSSRWLGIAI